MVAPVAARTCAWDDVYTGWLRDNLSRILNAIYDLVNLPPGSPEWCAARERARELLRGDG